MGSCQSLGGSIQNAQQEQITFVTQPSRITNRQITLIQAYIRGSLIRKQTKNKILNREIKSEQKQQPTEDFICKDQIPQIITQRSTVTQQIDDHFSDTPSQKSKSLSKWQNASFTGFGKLNTSDGYQNQQSQLLFGRNGINYFLIKWVNGLLNGEGVYNSPNGSYYKGQWANSQLNGKGQFYNSSNQTTYEGPLSLIIGFWQNNLQEGFGVEIYEDQSKYTGDFQNGRKNGQGQFEFADGSYYVGEFKSDKFHGKGKFVWENKTKIYDGEWECGKKNGFGTLEYIGKYIYKGTYKQGKKNGNGTLIYHDGRQYSGEWLDGQQHGYGSFQQIDGSICNGVWKFGLFQAP